MARRAKKAKPKKTKKTKATAKRVKPVAKAEAPPCSVLYRQGAVLKRWDAGMPIPQAMRDALTKHVPPLTMGERLATEAKTKLNEQLTGSLAESKPSTAPTSPLTISELRGAPEDKPNRRDLVG